MPIPRLWASSKTSASTFPSTCVAVEVALDHAEAKANRLPGADAERVNELLAELRAMLRRGESVEPGRLSKYEDLVKKYGWLAGPVLSTLSNVAFRIIGG
jgi:hypothetical protein